MFVAAVGDFVLWLFAHRNEFSTRIPTHRVRFNSLDIRASCGPPPIVTRPCRIVRVFIIVTMCGSTRSRRLSFVLSPPPHTVYSWIRNVLLCSEITVVGSLCARDDGRVASRSRGPGLGAHANDTVPVCPHHFTKRMWSARRRLFFCNAL